MWLPAVRLRKILHGNAGRPFQQVENLFRFGAAAGSVAALFAPTALRAGSAFGGAAFARRLETRVFPAGTAVAIVIFFWVVILSVFLWRQSPHDDIDPSVSAHNNSILKKQLESFALAIPTRLTRNLAQSQLGDESGVGRGEKQNVFLNRWSQMQHNHDLGKARMRNITSSVPSSGNL